MPVFALVDANNFYASCEKLFNPKLKDRPVVVLSNNDGCVVARSAEAKALGIAMGVPWFKIRDEARRHRIVAFSSNYALYADMSNRVVDILSTFSPNIEVYSIDESFLDLSGVNQKDHAAYGAEIRQRVAEWLGLSVCVGIGPTKTLAKFANHLAKKNAVFNGVCDLHALTRPERMEWMSKIEVGEVWGVGRRISKRLAAMGIDTVLELRNASPKEIRAQFGVVMERTCSELRGISCLALEEVAPPKQQIMSSKSFGAPVETIEELQEAVASYMARAAEKLRQQHTVSAAVYVFVETNRFRDDEPQHNAGITVPLTDGCDDTRTLTAAAFRGLKAIYRAGFRYKKAGVMLTLLSDKDARQATLFDDTTASEKSARLMAAMDAINREFGRDTLRSAAIGMQKRWAMRAGNRSPGYTTRWEELPVVG